MDHQTKLNFAVNHTHTLVKERLHTQQSCCWLRLGWCSPKTHNRNFVDLVLYITLRITEAVNMAGLVLIFTFTVLLHKTKWYFFLLLSLWQTVGNFRLNVSTQLNKRYKVLHTLEEKNIHLTHCNFFWMFLLGHKSITAQAAINIDTVFQ